jgi:beta-glucosidase
MGTAHIASYRFIHSYYRRESLPKPMVSFAANMQYFQPCSGSVRDRLAAFLRDRAYNISLLKRLIRSRAVDFIGLNYYTRQLVRARGWGLQHLLFDQCLEAADKAKKNSLGWDIYPRGLYALLMKLKGMRLPVFILENGVCCDDDSLRSDFIREHLRMVKAAMDEGVSVIGYIYWSLLDNFEWDKGFAPRFGLAEIDYNNFQRRVRQSARDYADVCAKNDLLGL